MHEGGLDARPDHGRGLQGESRLRGQPVDAGQDGVLDGRREVLTTGRDHLGDEEGVAAGLPEQGLGIDAGACRELGHRVRGQQRHLQPPYDRLRGDVAEHHPQRVGRTQVLVPIGRDDEDLGAVEPPGQEAHEVERGHVGPVQVLHDQDGGSGLAEGASAASKRPSRSPERSSSPTFGSRSGATSTSGPRGRGDDSGSHAPHSTRAREPAAALQARTSADFPRRPRRAPARGAPTLERVVVQTPEVREARPARPVPRPQGRRPPGARERKWTSRTAPARGPGRARAVRAPAAAGRGRPQLVRERGPGAWRTQRVALTAAAVLRAHEQSPERLAHRVPSDERLELGDRRRDTGIPEVGGDPAFEGVQAQRAEPLCLRLERRSPRTRRTAPRATGSARREPGWPRRPVRREVPCCPRHLPLENEGVDVFGVDVEDVASPAGSDESGDGRSRRSRATCD